MTPRPPWSQRQTAESIEQFFVLKDGVPDSLRNSLYRVFLEYFFAGDYPRSARIAKFERITGQALPDHPNDLKHAFWVSDDLLLDAIDHALQYSGAEPWSGDTESARLAPTVKSYLDDARSVYTVDHRGGLTYELAWRQPPEITELVEQATSERSRAAEHLRRAWSHAFARQPKPTDACLDAVKAVEAAARSTIEPNNSKATLGTMIKAVEQKPQKWTTSCPTDAASVETVAAMMRMIWKAHLRHGNPNKPLDVTVETCEMLVHTAAVLVHWFTTGRIRTVEPAEY